MYSVELDGLSHLYSAVDVPMVPVPASGSGVDCDIVPKVSIPPKLGGYCTEIAVEVVAEGGLACPADDLKVINGYVVCVLSLSPLVKLATRTVGGSVKGS